MRSFLVCAFLWVLISGCSHGGASETAGAKPRAELFARDATLQRFLTKREALKEQRRALGVIHGTRSAGVRDIDWELIVCDRFIETRERQLEAALGSRPEE